MTETETRINAILEVVQKVARGDLSVQVEISERNDTFDTLAMGINMMIDDIGDGFTKLKQAAEEWNRAFDSIADLVFIQDKDFRFIKVNKAVCDAFKVKPENLIGKKCYEVVHKRDKPWPNCPMAKTLTDKKPHTEEVDDPNIGVPLLISTSPLLDENGQLTGVIHIASDITERKKAEDELRLQAVIFNNIAEGICLVRASDSVIVYANPKFERMFGYGQGELNGKPVSIVNYSDEKKNAEQTARDIIGELTEKGEATYDVHNVKKDGTPFWCRATTSVFNHPVFGKVFVAVQGDITVEKQLKDELAMAFAELENKVRERTKELQEKVDELERFRKATIEREFRMKELSDKIERLKMEKEK